MNRLFFILAVTISTTTLYGQSITRALLPTPDRRASIESLTAYPHSIASKTISFIQQHPQKIALTAAGILCAGGAGYFALLFFFPEPLIIHATRSRNLIPLKILVFLGFNKEKMDSNNTTPLACAIESENLEAVKILCAAGANTNARWGPSLENTPLNNWHIKDNYKIAKCLIDHGAHVNNRDSRHYTPLHRALIFKHLKTALVLVENGAKLFLPELNKNQTNPWNVLKQEPSMALEFFQLFFPLQTEKEHIRPLLKATLSEFIKVMSDSVESSVLTEQIKNTLSQMDSGLTTKENKELISIVQKFIKLLYYISKNTGSSPTDENLQLTEEEKNLCEKLFVIE